MEYSDKYIQDMLLGHGNGWDCCSKCGNFKKLIESEHYEGLICEDCSNSLKFEFRRNNIKFSECLGVAAEALREMKEFEKMELAEARKFGPFKGY